MQYILTQEEYDNLVSKEKYYAEMDKVAELNKKVLELSKFTCVKKTQGCFRYCDFCPITKTCTEIKRYSK